MMNLNSAKPSNILVTIMQQGGCHCYKSFYGRNLRCHGLGWKVLQMANTLAYQ
jgi:hypothetical protein